MLKQCLPPEWQSAKVTHRIGATTYEIELVTASGDGPAGAGRDDGGTHTVLVTLEREMS